MKIYKLIILLVMILVQMSCSSFPTSRLERADIKDMHGLWFSEGYGYLINLQREHLDLYSLAGQSCIKEDYSLTELAYDFPYYQRLSPTQMVLGETPEEKMLAFSRLQSLPPICKTPSGSDALSVARAFSDIMQTHYPFFQLHGIDWQKRHDELLASLTQNSSDEQLAQSLFKALEGISDSHLGVLTWIDGKRKGKSQRKLRNLDSVLEPVYEKENPDYSFNRFRREWIADQRVQIADTLLGESKQSLADNKLVWGRIDNIGYLQVKQFLNYSSRDSERNDIRRFSSYIDTVLDDLAETDALIVDVSLSRGGYGSIAFELASRFLSASNIDTSDGLLVHKHFKYNLGPTDTREEFLLPSDRVQYSKPVFVVTSEASTSAAEEFIMAMRVQEQVKLIGQPSNGSLSDLLEKNLPNGWLMVLSHEVYLSPQGELFEKSGVPVDIPIALFGKSDAGESYQRGMANVVETVKREIE